MDVEQVLRRVEEIVMGPLDEEATLRAHDDLAREVLGWIAENSTDPKAKDLAAVARSTVIA